MPVSVTPSRRCLGSLASPFRSAARLAACSPVGGMAGTSMGASRAEVVVSSCSAVGTAGTGAVASGSSCSRTGSSLAGSSGVRTTGGSAISTCAAGTTRALWEATSLGHQAWFKNTALGPRCEKLGRWQRWAVMRLGWQQLVRQPRCPLVLPRATSRSVPCYRCIPCYREADEDAGARRGSSGCCSAKRQAARTTLKGDNYVMAPLFGKSETGSGSKTIVDEIRQNQQRRARQGDVLHRSRGGERSTCPAFGPCTPLYNSTSMPPSPPSPPSPPAGATPTPASLSATVAAPSALSPSSRLAAASEKRPVGAWVGLKP
eukprot:scaffold85499_cov65-Phaeocystis_antarctica.AAC.1